jgi:hypothetical protein
VGGGKGLLCSWDCLVGVVVSMGLISDLQESVLMEMRSLESVVVLVVKLFD